VDRGFPPPLWVLVVLRHFIRLRLITIWRGVPLFPLNKPLLNERAQLLLPQLGIRGQDFPTQWRQSLGEIRPEFFLFQLALMFTRQPLQRFQRRRIAQASKRPQRFDEKVHFHITAQSRLLMRRNVRDRVAALAPFLTFDKDAYIGTLNRLLRWHQRVKIFTTTLRKVHTAARHSFSAVTMISGEIYQAPVIQLDVLDRVGAGDAYAAGFIYGILAGESPQRAVDLGWAHGALVSTTPGDTTMVTLEQVKGLVDGLSPDIQR